MNRPYLALIVVASVLPMTSRARSQGPPTPDAPHAGIAVPKDVEARVRSVVPKGWTIATRGDTLVIRRDRKVRMINTINLPPASDDESSKRDMLKSSSSEESFEIELRFRPLLSQEEYSRFRAENEASGKKRDQLAEKVGRINHKFDQYLPSTPEERRLVEEYEKAVMALPDHKLPDLHDERNSIEVSETGGWSHAIIDKGVERECRAVSGKVHRLFRPYEAAPDPR